MNSASNALICTLPATVPLDIIGDVHGEWVALQRLLYHLGYDEYGRHPKGRRLVFVGDLCDRGPDSPAVLHWVMDAVAAGLAFAILGNHELNLLMNEAKDGSGWYFQQRSQDEQRYAPWHSYPPERKQQLCDTLSQWPLALYRDDVRVVHAAWITDSIRQLYEAGNVPLLDLYRQWETEFERCFRQGEWFERYQQERQVYGHHMEDEHFAMPLLPAMAHYDLLRSSTNPIRALTSGVQMLAQRPFFINGRWRFTLRLPWWQNYHDPVAVVVGHYWRHWYPQQVPAHRSNLFHEPATHWLGDARQVFCIDFSIGARWRERQNHTAEEQTLLHLAALRWPERQIVLDNGVQTESVFC